SCGHHFPPRPSPNRRRSSASARPRRLLYRSVGHLPYPVSPRMRRALHRFDGVHFLWRLLRRSHFFAERASRRLRAVSPPAHPRAPQGNRRRATQRLSLVHQLAFTCEISSHYFVCKRPTVSYHVRRSMEQIPRCLRHRSKVSSLIFSITLFALSISFFAASAFAQVAQFAFPGHKPADIPRAWRPLIGEYGPEQASFLVFEKSGKLVLRKNDGTEISLQRAAAGTFTLSRPAGPPLPVYFGGELNGHAVSISLGDLTFPRRTLGPEEGQVFRIQLSSSIEDLRQEALAASPPHEDGQFRNPDLIDLTSLDSSLHLDIRYATPNDFLGTPVYTQARAF